MHDLLLTPIVFLLTAVLLVPLAQRLGLGSVLGYLLGGCIIGPWGLALVHNIDTISHVAEIGVVLMLFLIGLELQPTKLLEMRAIVFGGGVLQMAACGIMFAVCIHLAGLSLAAALVAGLMLSLSSTAIAVQSMQENHLVNTPAGKCAFAILLFQDMAAMPMLGLFFTSVGMSMNLGLLAAAPLTIMANTVGYMLLKTLLLGLLARVLPIAPIQRWPFADLATLDAMFPYFRDEVKTISITQTARDALAKSFEQDGIRVKDEKK